MPDGKLPVALQPDTTEPLPKSDATRERHDPPSEPPATPGKTPPSRARRWIRWTLLLLLPLASIGGGYWYMLETLALYIRWQLTVTAPLPESEQAAARAAGEAWFQSFIGQLSRRVAAGRGLGHELAERVGGDLDAALAGAAQ